jgi:hypothetical protein
MKQRNLREEPPRYYGWKTVIWMVDKAAADVRQWKTVYEDVERKIQARGDERRAIDASTGEIIIEYKVVERPGATRTVVLTHPLLAT